MPQMVVELEVCVCIYFALNYWQFQHMREEVEIVGHGCKYILKISEKIIKFDILTFIVLYNIQKTAI